jgi:hypothetical protein
MASLVSETASATQRDCAVAFTVAADRICMILVVTEIKQWTYQDADCESACNGMYFNI